MNSPPIQAPETYLEILKQPGLLNHISDADYQAKLIQASAVKMVYPVDMLNVFALVDDVVWQVSSWHKVTTQQAKSKLTQIAQNRFVPHFDDTQAEIGTYDAVNRANQQLAEAGRDERYYWLMFRDDGVYGPYRGWGLMFLTYAQRHDPRLHKLVPFHPDQKHTWTQRRLDEFLAHLSELGLLAPYTPEQIANIRHALPAMEQVTACGIVRAFPGLSFGLDGDRVYEDITHVYRAMVERAVNASRGLFTPTNINCVALESSDDVTLSLECNGQSYQHTLGSWAGSDYVNYNYLVWMNEVLEQAGTLGVYRPLESYAEPVVILFLTSEQNTIAHEKAIISFNDDWRPFN